MKTTMRWVLAVAAAVLTLAAVALSFYFGGGGRPVEVSAAPVGLSAPPAVAPWESTPDNTPVPPPGYVAAWQVQPPPPPKDLPVPTPKPPPNPALERPSLEGSSPE